MFRSITNKYFVKKKILSLADQIFLMKNNLFEGLYLGLWNGIFFGIIWTITLNIFQLKNTKILVSIFAPFMMWFFIDIKFSGFCDLQNILFILPGSAISGFSGIIGSMLIKNNGLARVNISDAFFGLGIGLLIGTFNAYVLLTRGL